MGLQRSKSTAIEKLVDAANDGMTRASTFSVSFLPVRMKHIRGECVVKDGLHSR